ncbi:uncharacterized protein LOC109851923 isoform X2 [Pseudomyrmex gracilis]|uniref:uncharacterized protein LOC109851923 isoform X2 n=1 Tax=Pseudomyrmex gracilis TaxID=219809 RepID=UPI000995701E|nr:uncharacterized protein LOC109851923 isoform X2 [Pseudomyrmex gracilis]
MCSHFSCGCRLGKYPQLISSVSRDIVLELYVLSAKSEVSLVQDIKTFGFYIQNFCSKMIKVLAFLILSSVCLIINAQGTASNEKPFFGQTFDEIVVSSDLNVRRKSKENRQGKLLSNVPSGTTGPPEKPTATASRLVSADGSRITPEKREKRGIAITRRSNFRYLDLGVAGYLLKSRKR